MTAPEPPPLVQVVCDHCGEVVVGNLDREGRRLVYRPSQEATDRNLLLERPGFVRQARFVPPWPHQPPIEVWCERHGWLTFDADELADVGRRHPPGRPPATVRARKSVVR